MTARRLTANEVLGLGEDQIVEFKQSGSLMKAAFADLCGMINANPAKGTVVFGVSPNKAIVGLGSTNLDSFQQTLANHVAQKSDPPLQLEIEPPDCEGTIIVLITARRHREPCLALAFAESHLRYIERNKLTPLAMYGKSQTLREDASTKCNDARGANSVPPANEKQ